jgi:hypothetical protein
VTDFSKDYSAYSLGYAANCNLQTKFSEAFEHFGKEKSHQMLTMLGQELGFGATWVELQCLFVMLRDVKTHLNG